MLAGLGGPAAYALDTAASPHGGAIPAAGPSAGSDSDSFRDGPDGFRADGDGSDGDGSDGFPASDGGPPQDGIIRWLGGPASAGWLETDGGPHDGISELLNGSAPSRRLITLLQADATRYIWVAAAIGSNRAASYQLATGAPVMPVGGFNGTDPSPTLEQFQRYVILRQIHYLIGGNGFGRQHGGADTSRQIAAWVAQHFTGRTVDGVTIYDLTAVTS